MPSKTPKSVAVGPRLMETTAVDVRAPTKQDAAQIWRIVRDSGVLDVNSAYLYLVLCRDFSETCLVAEQRGKLAGFVSGYRLPHAPDVLFVWQIAVASWAKRQGIASMLLQHLVTTCQQQQLSAIEATISSSNLASRRLFQSLARKLDAPLEELPDEGFTVADFPGNEHESEPRIRIGPLAKKRMRGNPPHSSRFKKLTEG